MTRPFSARYGRLYDHVYASKDYAAEAKSVRRLLRANVPTARRILELGAGTGGHAEHLARWYRIVAIERSATMLAIARRKLAGRPVRLVRGDVATLPSFGVGFDACVSLFHVMNYLEPDDLARVLEKVAHCLRPGGIFLFDTWNAAAVLRHPPGRRRRVVQAEGRSYVRDVSSVVDWAASRCDVTISLFDADRPNRGPLTTEVHRMSYYLPGELTRLLAAAGLQTVSVTDDLGHRARPDSWSVRITARRAPR